MGVDGQQTLELRGPPDVLDNIQNSYMVIEGDETISLIARRFFGNQCEMKRRNSRYLVVEYEYRNIPIYEYLEALLRKHPQCWIKNQFSTDQGICGVWIGRTVNGQPSIQEQAWTELAYDEIEYGVDFSK